MRSVPRTETFRQRARLLLCGCFCGFDFGCGVGVLLGEAFDAASGVNQLLFAGEERVAIGADFDVELFAFDGRASLEIVAAGAVYGYGVIIGVNTGFHEAPFVRVRSARRPGLPGKSLTRVVVSYSRVARSRGKPLLYVGAAKIQNAARVLELKCQAEASLISVGIGREVGYVFSLRSSVLGVMNELEARN